jgi:hypothetical protein
MNNVIFIIFKTIALSSTSCPINIICILVIMYLCKLLAHGML